MPDVHPLLVPALPGEPIWGACVQGFELEVMGVPALSQHLQLQQLQEGESHWFSARTRLETNVREPMKTGLVFTCN